MSKLVLNIQKVLISANRHYAPRQRSQNPGIQRQLKALADKEINKVAPENVIDESESDFMQMHGVIKNIKNEERQLRDKTEFWIVKNKYFKKNLPNFLTWAEKEQIRHLHKYDPEEWNLANLTQSFPADSNTIYKIIKSKWMPADQKRIIKHDERVNKNWNEFKENKIEGLDDKLIQHLKKFSNREIQPPKFPIEIKPKELNLEIPKGEFSSILIDTKLKTRQSKIEEKTEFPEFKHIAAKSLNNTTSNTPVRWRDIKPNNDADVLENFEKNEIVMLEKKDIDNNTSMKKFTLKTKKDNVLVDINNDYKYCSGIKDNIKIPRNLWKRGSTYRLNDCFYDADGEFLYRVPGLSGT